MQEDDPMVTCPFDSAHRHRRSRIYYHISRCSKNDPRKHLFVNKRQCDFDVSHFVDKKDYEKHLEECPAARRILNFRNVTEDEQIESSILPVNANADANSNADGWGDGQWGSEANHPSYNPQEANQHRAIVQTQIGLSKAKRKQHRAQERRRINQLSQDE